MASYLFVSLSRKKMKKASIAGSTRSTKLEEQATPLKTAHAANAVVQEDEMV